MAKLQVYKESDTLTTYLFYCPGCKCHHSFNVRTDNLRPNWSFNGDLDKPTFTPSLFYPDRICHLFLTDGVIHYLGDSTHEFANKSVSLINEGD